MIKILIIIVLFLGISNFANSQRLEYKLKAGGVKLGDFKLEKHVFNDTTIYLLKSKVTLNFLFTKHIVDYSSLTIYYKGILIDARVKAVENGELDKSSITTKTKKGYHVSIYDDEEKKEYNFSHSGIKYSSTRLFFEQPVLTDSSYAELYGNFGDFEQKEPNRLVITNQKSGSETEYFYENSTPVKRKIEYPIVDFVMYLISNTTVRRSKESIYLEYYGKKTSNP